MKLSLRNLALGAAVAVAGVAMAQEAPVVTKTWAIEQVPYDGYGAGSQNDLRFGTGYNGKVYTVDKKNKKLVVISPDGVNTVDLSAYSPGTGITVDQAGNLLINQSFPNAASGSEFIIVPADGSEIKQLTLTYPEGIKAARTDQFGRIVGNILSEEGGAWYLTPNGSKVVGIAYVQNGAQAPLLDYMTTEELANPAVNTSTIAQPLAENITEFMELGDEAVNAFCIRNRSTKSVYDMSTGVGEPTIYTLPAGSHTQEGFDVFTLGGVRYQVVPITKTGANYETHFVIADTEGNIIFTDDYEFAGNGGQNFGSFTAHKVSENKVELYQWFACGAGALAAMWTIEIPEEPAKQVYSYFADDFEWLAPWSEASSAGATVEENNHSATSPQLVKAIYNEVSAYDALLNKGYSFLTSKVEGKKDQTPGQQIYINKNYLKFGKTDYFSGITLPAVKNVPAGANVTLSFDASSQRRGTGMWDPTELVVIVKNGEDVKTYPVVLPRPADTEGEPYTEFKWEHLSVVLEGAIIDKNTTISIRNSDAQWPGSNALRWFMDNVSLTGDAEPLPVMPDLYLRGDFNEWGTTVPMVLAEEKPEGYDGAYTVTLESLPAGELKVGNADWSVSVGAGDNPAITLGAELEALNNGQKFKLADELIDATITLYYNVKPDAKSMLKVEGTKGHRFAGKGTADEPYLIATPADLCAIYTLNDGRDWKEFYFKQTADIDMAGVEVYHTIAGHNGLYQSVIHYDGDFHAIKNFGPKDAAASNPNSTCYVTSIFGVPTGTIKNLGVVDAKVETVQGAGVLGAYAGQSGHPLTVENVYVTGTVKGTGGYTGGLFGTTAAELTLNNVYFNGTVEGSGFTGGLVGRLRNPLILNNAYVAGTVTATDAAKGALVASSDKSNIDVMANNFVAFNSGVENVTVGCTVTGEIPVATDETKEALVNNIKKNWEAYNECRELAGYPAFNWQKECEVVALPLPARAAMAYGLAIAANGNDNYSITFKATEAGQAAITFTNQADATDVVTIGLGAVTKGENTVGVSTGDLKGGTYNWAIDIISNIEGEAPVLVYAGETPEQMVRGGVVTITDETVPAYGYTIVAHGKWQGFDVYDPEGEHVGTFHKGFKQSANQSAPFRGAEREGLAVFADWSDATAGYWVVDPLNPTAEPYNLLAAPGATVAGTGLYTTAEGVITAGGSAAIAFQGKGDDTVMYGFEEDRPDASNVVVAWPIGSAQYLTVAPKMIFSGVAPAEGSNIPTNEGGVNTKSKFANTNVDILAIENGFFASQIRANGKEVGTPPFMYITNDGQEGYNAGLEEIMESSSAGIAITKDRSVFAASMNDAIRFFSVEWDENGFPVMAKLADVEVPGLRWAQMRFDAANNLHVYARECGGYRVYALNGEGTATTAAPVEMAVTKVPDGISDIAVDAANGDAVYYNLNGVRIAADNLVPGVYVKVVNGKATKVVVK